jgi:CheY-like chemotaxis protein
MTKIVIVEDDPMISEIYQKKFVEAGFEVMAVAAGDQVLEAVKNQKVDLVLLDLMMPKMDGFEVISHLRDGSYDSEIKIIVSSNLSQREDRERCIKLGADGFVTKSDYTPSELVKEIQRLLDIFEEEKKNAARRLNGNKNTFGDVKPKKILMIEDEEVFIDMFGGKLKQDGFEVDFARNGVVGIKEALKGDYDLYIIDMITPAMTGAEIIEKLKSDDHTKNVPIFAYSASTSNDDDIIKRVKELGVSEVHSKTQIIPSQLSKKVAEVLSRATE